MALERTGRRIGPLQRHRRLLPVWTVVVVYAVAGLAWIVGRDSMADSFTDATSVPAWLVEVGQGVVFITLTALVLYALMGRRADWLAVVSASAHEDELALTESEDRTNLLLDALSGAANAVVITDRGGTIEWVNEAFETMSGYSLSAAVSATPRLVILGGQGAASSRDLWATVRAGQVWRGQAVHRRRDGERYTVSQTITPVVAESGELEHFVVIQEDISERVRVQRDLESSRLRLQALFDHALDAIVLADDRGRYVAVNLAACELTGYSREELIGMRPADLAAPDAWHAVTNQFHEFLDERAESGTFTLRHKDSHVVETEYRAVSNIQPGVHLSVLRDVTQRNLMLQAVTVAEAQFRGLAENAADIVAKLRVGSDGRMEVDYVNPAATTILGYPKSTSHSDPALLLQLFRGQGDDLADALALLPTPQMPTRLTTVEVRHLDGRPVWLEVHSTLTDPSTTPVTIQLVARDVTARFEMTHALEQALQDQLEAAEQLRALNAMKDTFLQSVSHELRTPLTSILGFAQLLADPGHALAPGDTRDFHRRILANAKRLQRLLDDLLDIDRFTRGNVNPDRSTTDVSDLIERVVGDVELGEHPVELDLEPVTMEVDALWVERIVANLLRNVVRHTPPRTRVWVRVRATTDGLELIVDDDGPGIPEADRQRVMEPFQQGVGSASAAEPGTGVGLALVDSFAQLHGGALILSARPAGGTRATVTLTHVDASDRDVEAGALGLEWMPA